MMLFGSLIETWNPLRFHLLFWFGFALFVVVGGLVGLVVLCMCVLCFCFHSSFV